MRLCVFALSMISLSFLQGCSLPQDKVLHFTVGGALQPAQAAAFPGELRGSRLERCAGAIAIGTLKEVGYDGMMGRGQVEPADMVATAAGCLLIDFLIEDVWRERLAKHEG